MNIGSVMSNGVTVGAVLLLCATLLFSVYAVGNSATAAIIDAIDTAECTRTCVYPQERQGK